MVEYVDVLCDDGGEYQEAADPTQATLRVTRAVWDRYCKAVGAMRGAAMQIEKSAKRPVYCTPEQEEALRSVAKPGAWIVVREAAPLALVATPVTADEPVAVESTEPMAEPPAPPPDPGPPRRPRPGPCAQRGGLQHTALRYVITEAMSEYDIGRMRIDGLCSCGERIPDVRCPHQKQVLDEITKSPMCAWCRQRLVSGAGVVDNRKPDGSRDPKIHIEIDNDAVRDDAHAARAAYRAPGS